LIYHNLGITHRNQGDIAVSIEHHENEKRIAEEENDLARLSGAYASLGIEFYEQLEIDKALEYYGEALAITERKEFQTSNQSAYVYRVSRDSHKVGLVYGVSTGNWQKFNRLPIFGNRGVAETLIGRYEDALNSLQEAIQIAEETGHRRFEAVWRNKKGVVYYFLGEYEKAIRCHTDSLELAESIPAPRAIGFGRAGLGKTQLALAYLDPARNDFQFDELIEAFNIATRIKNPRDLQEWGADLAEAYLYAGRLDDARNVIEQVLHHNIAENKYRVAVLDGLIQACCGNQVEFARHAFEEALTITDEILAKTPEFFAAKYTRGLALSGLAILSEGNKRETYIAEAQKAYHDAYKTSPAKGAINDALRLLDAFKKLDPDNELAPVRVLLS
jgi:tetratricopeptide (TPR) repeat protein